MDKIYEFEARLTGILKWLEFDVIVWHIEPERISLRVEKYGFVYQRFFTRVEIEQAGFDAPKYWSQVINDKFNKQRSGRTQDGNV